MASKINRFNMTLFYNSLLKAARSSHQDGTITIMGLTKKQRKFIKLQDNKLSPIQISEKLGVKEKQVLEYIKELGNHTQEATAAINNTPKVTSLKTIGKFVKASMPSIILLAIMCIIVYGNALNGQLVSDDIGAYVQNKAITTPKNFLTPDQWNFQNFLYVVIYALSKTNPIPLHMVSLVLHVLNTVLVFIFCASLFNRKVARTAGLLFAVHPLNTETVSWISSYNYLFNSLLLFTILILYTLYKNTQNKKYMLAGSGIYAICAIGIRQPWVLIIPPILFIYDQITYKTTPKFIKRLLNFSPILLGAGIYILFDLVPKMAMRVETMQASNFGDYDKPPVWITIPYTIATATKLLLFPKNLTFYHDGEITPPYFYPVAGAITVALISLIIGLAFTKKCKGFSAILLIMLASILPTFSPIQVSWYMAERYLYIATAFFCMILAYFLTKGIEVRKHKRFFTGLVICLLGVYSIRTIRRNIDWQTQKKLWEATAKISVNSPRIYNNLGDIYGKENDYAKAIATFQKAIRLDPYYADAMHNLARTFLEIGEKERAREQFLRSLEVNPNLYQSYFALGALEYNKQNYTNAKYYFTKALEIEPSYEDAKKALEITLKNIP